MTTFGLKGEIKSIYVIDFQSEGIIEFYNSELSKTKHSKNIIDLIEIGDIVEWWYEDNYIQDFVKDFVYEELLEYFRNSKCNEDIKSIVTREQYKSVEYVF